MDMRTVRSELGLVLRDFEARHWQTAKVFLDRFEELEAQLGLTDGALQREKKLLIGAYFCHEYSYAAAALMNPSIVPHPDQSGLSRRRHAASSCPCARSARGTSARSPSARASSTPTATFELWPEPPFATAATRRRGCADRRRTAGHVHRHARQLALRHGDLPDHRGAAQRAGGPAARAASTTATADCEWIGTYTAYSGAAIRSELLRTARFPQLQLEPMTGPPARNKGMALFPRKIGGELRDDRPAGRQEPVPAPLRPARPWDDGTLLLEPRYPWELIQIGNCGARSSPTRAGWCSPTASARCANIRSARRCSTRTTPRRCSAAPPSRC